MISSSNTLTQNVFSVKTENPIYTRRFEGHFEFTNETGESIFELLGKDNGNSEQHSIAHVEIRQGGSSMAHYHPESEESYVIMEGQGRLVIGRKTRIVTPGDVIKIPVEKVHQIFNDSIGTLKLLCICAPAWQPKCLVPAEMAKNSSFELDDEIYIRKKEDCSEINAGKGEFIRELLGKDNGKTEQHSIAHVKICQEGSSTAHYHPKSEESYVILEGQGRLVIGEQEKVVKSGDVAKIPVGKVHQIFNDHADTLKFLCVCAPAWKPDCIEYA